METNNKKKSDNYHKNPELTTNSYYLGDFAIRKLQKKNGQNQRRY